MRQIKRKAPSPTSLMVAMSRVDQLKQLLGESPDPKLVLDTIEGETQTFELLDALCELALADKKVGEEAADRAKRLKQRAEKWRGIARQVMDRIGLPKLERPVYTISFSAGTPSLVITDTSRIPRELMAPDKDAIKAAIKAGREIPGCTLNNSPPVMRISGK